MENKILQISLVTSLCLHIFALGSFLHYGIDIRDAKPSPEIVYYVDAAAVPKVRVANGEKIPDQRVEPLLKAAESPRPAAIPIVDKKEFLAPTHLSQTVEKHPSPFNISEKPVTKMDAFSKSHFKSSQSFAPVVKDAPSSLNDPALNRRGSKNGSDPASGKKGVSVPVLKSEKISNPRYFQYSNTIREKIKNKAYHYIDNPRFQNGEVCLSFSISSAGILKQIRIIDNKTMANDYLRGVGLRSIKEASPFPSFPGDLPYPELSFNVVISFELDKTEVK